MAHVEDVRIFETCLATLVLAVWPPLACGRRCAGRLGFLARNFSY
jgi:hypothetical protein